MKRTISVILILIISLCHNLPVPTYADLYFSKTSSFQKGMCFATWSKEKYRSPFSDESLLKMKEIGVEWVAIVCTWYQKEYNSTEIFPTDKTPSDKSLEYVINKAHEIGLKVMLKPHLDLINQD